MNKRPFSLVTLTTPRIKLETIQFKHSLDGFLKATEGRADLWNYMFYGNLSEPSNMEDYLYKMHEAFQQGKDRPFVILANADFVGTNENDDGKILARKGEIIGGTRIRDINMDHKSGEIGTTWVKPSLQGYGVGNESKLALLKYIFEHLHFIRVQFKVDVRNKSSNAALVSLGAKQEGVLRKAAIMPDGIIRDTNIYSIIHGEWFDIRTVAYNKLVSKNRWPVDTDICVDVVL